MPNIKVLIIDQSISVCNRIKNIITQQTDIDIVGMSTDIIDGIELILSKEPDVVLLDVKIPRHENKASIEVILETKAVPVIMLSENNVKQTAKTVQAMSNGAVDFIKKSNEKQQQSQERFEKELITKIKNAYHVKRVRTLAKKEHQPEVITENSEENLPNKVPRQIQMANKNPFIVIGTSTGGPRALQRIIEQLPEDFPAPILIVQHMPAMFTNSLASRLNNVGKIRVKEAVHGEIIVKSTVYIAPGNYHMKVKENGHLLTIELNQEEEILGHRPSVDVLFESLAQTERIHKIAVVLTGMGKDGAEGVRKIKQSQPGAIIIAESKETAVIDGMPNAAIATNCVTEILRLEDIANALVDYLK